MKGRPLEAIESAAQALRLTRMRRPGTRVAPVDRDSAIPPPPTTTCAGSRGATACGLTNRAAARPGLSVALARKAGSRVARRLPTMQ